MALVRWGDWDPLKTMERMMDAFLPSRVFSEKMLEMRFPALDVEEKGDAMVVTAELPGIKPDDVKVELDGALLTITGEKKEEVEKEDTERKVHYRERAFGSFSRTIRLAEEVDPEAVAAVFEDGLLKVTLKKAAAKKRKEIPIKGGRKK